MRRFTKVRLLPTMGLFACLAIRCVGQTADFSQHSVCSYNGSDTTWDINISNQAITVTRTSELVGHTVYSFRCNLADLDPSTLSVYPVGNGSVPNYVQLVIGTKGNQELVEDKCVTNDGPGRPAGDVRNENSITVQYFNNADQAEEARKAMQDALQPAQPLAQPPKTQFVRSNSNPDRGGFQFHGNCDVSVLGVDAWTYANTPIFGYLVVVNNFPAYFEVHNMDADHPVFISGGDTAHSETNVEYGTRGFLLAPKATYQMDLNTYQSEQNKVKHWHFDLQWWDPNMMK